VAKKRTLFDDPAVEIEELTFIIKQNIQNLNQQIATLREYSKTQGTHNKQHEAHSDTIVNYLNSKLAVTAKDFKDILQVRTEVMFCLFFSWLMVCFVVS
jgi:syntaxin 5